MLYLNLDLKKSNIHRIINKARVKTQIVYILINGLK